MAWPPSRHAGFDSAVIVVGSVRHIDTPPGTLSDRERSWGVLISRWDGAFWGKRQNVCFLRAGHRPAQPCCTPMEGTTTTFDRESSEWIHSEDSRSKVVVLVRTATFGSVLAACSYFLGPGGLHWIVGDGAVALLRSCRGEGRWGRNRHSEGRKGGPGRARRGASREEKVPLSAAVLTGGPVSCPALCREALLSAGRRRRPCSRRQRSRAAWWRRRAGWWLHCSGCSARGGCSRRGRGAPSARRSRRP